MKAPYTDQFSLGVEREVANNLAIGVNFICKNGGNQLGWIDTGGAYGTQNVVINGQNITVFPLLNAPSARSFLRTNGPGYYNQYTALILTATRRLANRWQFTAGYTRQQSEGLEPGAARRGPWCKSKWKSRGTRPERPDQPRGASGCTGPTEHGLVDGLVRDSEDRSPGVREPDHR